MSALAQGFRVFVHEAPLSLKLRLAWLVVAYPFRPTRRSVNAWGRYLAAVEDVFPELDLRHGRIAIADWHRRHPLPARRRLLRLRPR